MKITPSETRAKMDEMARINSSDAVSRYSVYEIMEKLRELGVYEQVKQFLVDNDLWDRIAIIGDVRSDNVYFTQYYPVVKATLAELLPDVDIDEKLAKCVAKED